MTKRKTQKLSKRKLKDLSDEQLLRHAHNRAKNDYRNNPAALRRLNKEK